VPAFVQQLATNDSITSRALEFTVLTACRSGEVLRATWDEIDLKQKLWTIPESRTKSGRELRVPLSRRVLELLKALPRLNGYVFPGSKSGQPLNRNAMNDTLGGKVTVHGFRSSFRDWCGDRTNYPRDIMEAALGHKLTNETEAAYRRGDALEKRRRLMEEWSKFLSSEPVTSSEVVKLHG
jgi:integrase